MDVRAALKGQYRGALAMLRQTIERCPDEVWLSGQHPRTVWRIAYHALFYTHLYLQPDLGGFTPWEEDRSHAAHLEALPWPPHEMPEECEPYSRADVLRYLDLLTGMIDEGVDRLDLDSEESGFPWYDMPKLDHQIVNIRHIQQHVGEISELLFRQGMEDHWVGRA